MLEQKVKPRRSRPSRLSRLRAILVIVSVASISASHTLFVFAQGSASGQTTVSTRLSLLRAVGAEGRGTEQAATALKELAAFGPDALPEVLAAFDGANPAAANWLRTAFDAIAERAAIAQQPLPIAVFAKWAKDPVHAAAGRKLAYEWLARSDPAAAQKLVGSFINDPVLELRREAVAAALKTAPSLSETADRELAFKAYRSILSSARDRDQVEAVAKKLKSLGSDVNLPAHFGFVVQWNLAGPFDNTGDAAFEKIYAPEQSVDLAATYVGKGERPVKWIRHTTADPYGIVDLNPTVADEKGVIAYGFATVVSATQQPVQIRVGSNNKVKVFLNGQLVFAREVARHGMRMDQHSGQATLKAGRNQLLIKVCKDEDPRAFARQWSFQLRLCDELGGAVPVTVADEANPPTGKGDN